MSQPLPQKFFDMDERPLKANQYYYNAGRHNVPDFNRYCKVEVVTITQARVRYIADDSVDSIERPIFTKRNFKLMSPETLQRYANELASASVRFRNAMPFE